MQKDKKPSGFLNIISKMNANIAPIPSASSARQKLVAEKETVQINPDVKELSIGLIEPNEKQPRKYFDETALSELAASISEHGVIQPIIVTKQGGKFVIVAGERRYRAAKAAGLKKLPVIIRDVTEREMREISLIENLQREGLNPIEEAEAICALLEEYSLTQDELAASLGKSRPALTNSIRLLKLPPEVIEMVRGGKLSGGHARALLSLKEKSMQIKFAKEAILKKISVHELEARISRMASEKAPVKVVRQSLELKAMEKSLQRVFATKVKISGDDNKGKILIEYFSKGELQKIYELIDEIQK